MAIIFQKGKTGSKKSEVLNEYYTYNVKKGCQFSRYANKLYMSVTALRDHIIGYHKIKEEIDAVTVRNIDLVDLRAWLDDNKELLSFEDGLVN